MALAFSVQLRFPPLRGIRMRIVKITADTDYPTGGWPVTAANVQLTAIYQVFPMATVAGYVLEWDATNSKLIAYWGDNNNASDGPLIEIPAGDNGIDTKVFACLVIGR